MDYYDVTLRFRLAPGVRFLRVWDIEAIEASVSQHVRAAGYGDVPVNAQPVGLSGLRLVDAQFRARMAGDSPRMLLDMERVGLSVAFVLPDLIRFESATWGPRQEATG